MKHVTVARCPSCGAALAQEPLAQEPLAQEALAREPLAREPGPPLRPPPAHGGTTPRLPPETAAQAIENLYREVMRLREIAEFTQAAGHGEREARLLEEIRQLRVTVARLRGTTRVTGT